MATAAELRQRVFENLYSNSRQSRPALQRLAGSVADTDADTTVAVDDGTEVSKNDIIEFQDGEQGLVWAVSSNNLTVLRAQNGTLSTTHGDNELIRINPVWTIKQVDDALAEALRDMSAQGLYQLAAGTDITLVSGTDLYELTETDARIPQGVRAVFYQESTTSDLIGVPFRNEFDPESQELTGNVAVRLLDWGNNADGDTLEVLYAQDLTGLLGSITEPIIEDAAVWFATAKLLMASEGPRIHDPGRFTDRTVQPGQGLRDGGFFQAQYQRAVWRYKAALRMKEKRLPGARWRRVDRFVR